MNVLTGDRPTGKLHLGHYVGSLMKRVELQSLDSMTSNKKFILIADTQAMTDNFENSQIISSHSIEIIKDYLAVGIDPTKWTIFLQSEIKQLFELTFYLMNLATFNNLKRIPTLKVEIDQKSYSQKLPMGFLNYPVSQAADLLLFDAELAPVGEDQICIIEFVNDLARQYNKTYKVSRFKTIKPLLGRKSKLLGINGKQKASKSLNNAIFLSDDLKTLKAKVQKMYTDPGHIKISDPGQVEGNVVFHYLETFYNNKEHLEELKSHYSKGGLSDSYLKNLLTNTLFDLIEPIRLDREKISDAEALEVLKQGTILAREFAEYNMDKIRKDLKIMNLDI